ncbi:MAG TPA: hypothetical protein V6C78_23870, partial [Crinalium sp.]
ILATYLVDLLQIGVVGCVAPNRSLFKNLTGREFDSPILRARRARKIGLLEVLRDVQHLQKPDHC